MHAIENYILCRTSTKNSYAMNTIKILLTYYLNVSVHTQIYQIAESSRIKKSTQ